MSAITKHTCELEPEGKPCGKPARYKWTRLPWPDVYYCEECHAEMERVCRTLESWEDEDDYRERRGHHEVVNGLVYFQTRAQLQAAMCAAMAAGRYAFDDDAQLNMCMWDENGDFFTHDGNEDLPDGVGYVPSSPEGEAAALELLEQLAQQQFAAKPN